MFILRQISHGRVWDVTYEDLTMYDVPTAIQLNEFYFAKPGDPPSTMRFDHITFRYDLHKDLRCEIP